MKDFLANLFNPEKSDQKFVEIACDAQQRERTIMKLTAVRAMMLPLIWIILILFLALLVMEIVWSEKPFFSRNPTHWLSLLLTVSSLFLIDFQIKFLKTISAMEKAAQKTESDAAHSI